MVVALVSWLILGETPTWNLWAGMGLCLLGVALVSRVSDEHARGVPLVSRVSDEHARGVPLVSRVSDEHARGVPLVSRVSDEHARGVPLVSSVVDARVMGEAACPPINHLSVTKVTLLTLRPVHSHPSPVHPLPLHPPQPAFLFGGAPPSPSHTAGVLWALLAALASGAVFVMLRFLRGKENANTIAFWFHFSSLLASVPFVAIGVPKPAVWPNAGEMACLLGVTAGSFWGQVRGRGACMHGVVCWTGELRGACRFYAVGWCMGRWGDSGWMDGERGAAVSAALPVRCMRYAPPSPLPLAHHGFYQHHHHYHHPHCYPHPHCHPLRWR